jgi:hypothetical protein
VSTARNNKIETRTDVAVSILWGLDPTGRQDLAAIDLCLPKGHPGKIEAATFEPSQRGAASAWIEARQGIKNIYTSVNRAAATAPTARRLKKENIGTIRAVVLDVDPAKIKGGDASGENFKRERARLFEVVTGLAGTECPPTLIVDSGGGYQAWWQLAEQLPATAENVALVEGIGRTIQNRYGGDSIWEVAHIMRLPGTINVPDPEKAAQGRTPALASVLPLSTGLPVTIEALRTWAPPTAQRAKPDAKLPEIELPEADHYAELPSALRQKFEAARNKDPVLGKLWGGTPAPEQSDISPSGYAFALAGRLGRAGDFNATEFGALLAVWDHRTEKELDARYIARAWANNAATAGPSGFNSVTTAERDGGVTPSDRGDFATTSSTAEWGEPINLWSKERIPAELPVGVLPEIVENQAREMARSLGVNAGAPAAVLVTALGSMVPASNVMQMRQLNPDWTVRAITWTTLVGSSAANKSAPLNVATSFLKEIEKGWRREYTGKKQQYDALEARRNKKRKSLPAKDAPAGADEGAADEITSTDDVFEGAAGAGDLLGPNKEPRPRRKIINDATTEEIASVLQYNPDGVLQFRDELTGWLGSMDAYRPSATGGKDRPFWLEAKEGSSYLVDRKTSGLVAVENLAISVLGTIQPEKIKPTLLEDGLLQRFAPIFIQRNGIGEDFAPDLIERERMGRVALAVANSVRKQRFLFSPEADQVRSELEAFKEREIERPTTTDAVAQWLNKLPNEFGRFSLIFHFIEWYASEEGQTAPPDRVSLETAQRAARYLTEFVYSHVRALYSIVLGNSRKLEQHAVRIAGFILARRREHLTARDIERAYKSIKKADAQNDLGATMGHLAELEWVRPTKDRGGEATAWDINPTVHDGRFEEIAAAERARRDEVQEKIKHAGED